MTSWWTWWIENFYELSVIKYVIVFILHRYIYYFAGLLSGAIKINSSPLYLHQVHIPVLDNYQPGGGTQIVTHLTILHTHIHLELWVLESFPCKYSIQYHKHLNPNNECIYLFAPKSTSHVSNRLCSFPEDLWVS